MAAHPVAMDLIARNFAPDIPGGGMPFREIVRLLAEGEPVAVAQLAAVTGLLPAELERQPAWPDVEFDELGRIVGWGLTFNPTVHGLVVGGRQLYVWCAGDTLLIPILLGRRASVESTCPATNARIRFTVDPADGVVDLDPEAAVIAYPPIEGIGAVRNDFCVPHRLFASTVATSDWAGRHAGGCVLGIREAYDQVIRPFSERILSV